MTGRAARALRQVFGIAVTSELFLSTGRVRFAAGPRVLGTFDDAPPLHMTMRHAFDARLHEAACAAGARPVLRARVADIDGAARTVTLQGGRQLSFGVLIGADGVNSQVARHLFGRAFDPATIAFALEVEAPPVPDTVVEIDFEAAPWGYGWVFPKHGSLTIGVGGMHAVNPDLRARLSAYLARHRVRSAGLRCKGHFLPAGDVRTVPGRGAVLLAGDAAGLVDPMTGEGIAHAIASGALAADAAAAALQAGRPEGALDRYACALAPLQAEIRRARRLQHLVFSPLSHGAMMRIFAANPSLQRRTLRIVAGETDYADLRRGFLRKVLAHSVRALLPSRPG